MAQELDGLNVSILGGGSAYTPGLVEDFIRQKKDIPVSKLVLMDIDQRKLEIVGSYVDMMLKTHLPDCELVLTTHRETAILGMDFIICQIRVGGLTGRHIDEYIPMKYGVIGQETTGPGGFSMALRTIPVMVEIAREIEEKNPSAWLINYTNPTGMVAEAVGKTSNIKHAAICDEPMVLQESLASFLNVSPGDLFFDYFGLNHLSWARRVFLQGEDVLPKVRKALKHTDFHAVESLFGEELLKDPKVKTELVNTLRIFEESGMMPSPYLQYYWFTDEISKEQAQIGITRAQQVMEMEKRILAEYEDALEHGRQPYLQRGGKWHADMMVGIVGAIANDTRSVYIVNVPNHGALPDIPYDKVVEVTSLVDASGPHPLAMGKMPAKIRGLIQSVAAYEELTVQAALEGSYEIALDALSCHPLVPSRKVAKSILDEYKSEHKASLSYLK